jgi:hypothetical protein
LLLARRVAPATSASRPEMMRQGVAASGASGEAREESGEQVLPHRGQGRRGRRAGGAVPGGAFPPEPQVLEKG